MQKLPLKSDCDTMDNFDDTQMCRYTRSQSYKANFGIIKPFFGIIYAIFLRMNLSVKINAKINTEKCIFDYFLVIKIVL